MIESELLLKRNLRDEVMNDERLEVLDKVKVIATLPNSEWSVVEQVANYYEVGIEAIKSLVKRNQSELISNGYKLLTGIEVKEILVSCNVNFTNNKGYFSVGDINFANRSNGLFNKRSILNIGMLLEESPVAKEVRSLLLDNHFQLKDVHDKLVNGEEIEIDKTDPNYFINKEVELREQERTIISKMTEAIMKGDMQSYMAINCEANNIKEQIILLGKEKEELVKPKVNYYEKVLNPNTYTKLLTSTAIAKDLSMTAQALNKELHELKIIYKGKDKSWYLYKEYENKIPEYADYTINEHGQTLKWTERGREWIIGLLKENFKIAN